MNKHDFISDLSSPVRYLSITAMALSTLVCCTGFLLSVAFAIAANNNVPLGQRFGCVLIFSILMVLCGWITIRLMRNKRSSNGRTLMPTWFIQTFGIVFLIATCSIAFMDGRLWLFGNAFCGALAMIGVRYLLKDIKFDTDLKSTSVDRNER